MFDFLAEKFSNLFHKITAQSTLTENNIAEVFQSVQDCLLEADVPYSVVVSFLDQLKIQVLGSKIITSSVKPGEQFAKIVYERLTEFLGGKHNPENFSFTIPSVVMMIGLQGSGKTTTLAKLAYYAQEQAQKRGKKRKIVVSSVDFYRPAALEQLEILSKQIQATYYKSSSTKAIQAAQDAVEYFKRSGADILFLDTAGRLHIDQIMMDEIKQIHQTIKPTYTFLVLDAMSGQESLVVAQTFNQTVGFDYAIMSKTDSNTRAGSAFAFRYSLHKSILFLGCGEKLQDLERFYPERIASRIIGQGDINSLIERAESKIQAHHKETIERSFKKNNLTLNDFAQQLEMVSSMGSLSQLAKSLPFMGANQPSEQQLQQGQQQMKVFKAIISSMTPKERAYPALLDISRKQRIARGAGVETSCIKVLLDRFEKTRQFVKILKKWSPSSVS